MVQGVTGPRKHAQREVTARCNKTLSEPYLAVQFYGNTTYNWIRQPPNLTSEVHGIAQSACDKNKMTTVVVWGETWAQLNETVYYGNGLINNSNCGKLNLYSNTTVGCRRSIGYALQTVANGNATKIGTIMVQLGNITV